MKSSFFAILISTLLAACGTDAVVIQDSNSCANGTAVIAVLDGALQISCGCNEASGTTALPDEDFTCTVDSGSTVVFQYVSQTNAHQIAGTGSPDLGTSPQANPNDSNPITVYSVLLSDTGTYEFQDLLQPTLSGSIVVE